MIDEMAKASTKTCVLRELGNYGSLETLSEELQDDKEVVMAAIQRFGSNFKYASLRLRDDKETVMEAVTQHADTLEYASVRLRNDKEVVMAALAGGAVLRHASDILQNDREVVIAAVSKKHLELKYASSELKDDKEIVMMVVLSSRWDSGLCNASDRLKNNKDIVMAALTKSKGRALEHVSLEMKNDRDIVKAAIAMSARTIEHASDALKNDREIMTLVLKKNGSLLIHASDTLKNDQAIVMMAVTQDGDALEHASSEFKNDREIVMLAMTKNGSALEFASDELKNDRQIVLAAVAQDSSAMQYANDRLKKNHIFNIRALTQVNNDQSSSLPLCTSIIMFQELASRWGISEEELIDFQIKFAGETVMTLMYLTEEEYREMIPEGIGCSCVIACSEESDYDAEITHPIHKDEDPLKLTGPFDMIEPMSGAGYGTSHWEEVGGMNGRGAASFLMDDSRYHKPRKRKNRSFTVMLCHADDGDGLCNGGFEAVYHFNGNWTQKDLEARMLAIFRVMWLTGSPQLNKDMHERLELLIENKKKKRTTKTKGSKKSKKSKTVANSTAFKIKQEAEVEVNIPGLVGPLNIAMGTTFHYKFAGYGVWQGFIIGYDTSTKKYSVVFKKEGEEDDLKTYTSARLAGMMKINLPTDTLDVKIKVEVEASF